MVFSLMVFFGINTIVSTVKDYHIINDLNTKSDNYLKQINKLKSEVNYTNRLNDLLSGRLYEILKFTTGQIDPSLDTFQRLIDKIKLDLDQIKKESANEQ